jgi:hypothetical protein
MDHVYQLQVLRQFRYPKNHRLINVEHFPMRKKTDIQYRFSFDIICQIQLMDLFYEGIIGLNYFRGNLNLRLIVLVIR